MSELVSLFTKHKQLCVNVVKKHKQDVASEISYSNSNVTGCLFTVVVPRPTQPSIPLRSVSEHQLWLRRQSQVWFILFVDKFVGGR